MGIMEPIFRKLKTAWDDGISNGPITASDGGLNYFSIKNITYNMLLYGSPEIFDLKKESKDKLLQAYVSGVTRRSFVYHNIDYKPSENRNRNFEKMTLEEIKKTDDYLKELRFFMNNTEHINLPLDVYSKLQDYDEEKQIERERSTSLIAESLGSALKIEKLLGIIAVLDLSNTITEEHLKWAIQYTEIIDKTTEDTIKPKPTYMQIYEELEKNTYLARTDIIRAVRNVTIKTLEDEMVLVEEFANKVGNSLIVKNTSKIISYKLEKMTNADLEKVIISVNENPSAKQPQGFEKKRGNFFNIHKIINSEKRYSAGTFKNEYINDNNYMEEQNLFIIDVDDGMTIQEAKDLFFNWTYLITTTRSHQKPKGEDPTTQEPLVRDRFRIIFPTISTFHLDYKTYSQMYINVLNALNIPYDEKCKNASRWYYGNQEGEHWYNRGDMLDIRPFIPDSIEQQNTQQAISNYESNDYTDNIDARVDGTVRWFIKNTSAGNRHDNLFKLCMLLKDPNKVNYEDWEATARYVNSCLIPPISEADMNSTIRSAQRR